MSTYLHNMTRRGDHQSPASAPAPKPVRAGAPSAARSRIERRPAGGARASSAILLTVRAEVTNLIPAAGLGLAPDDEPTWEDAAWQ